MRVHEHIKFFSYFIFISLLPFLLLLTYDLSIKCRFGRIFIAIKYLGRKTIVHNGNIYKSQQYNTRVMQSTRYDYTHSFRGRYFERKTYTGIIAYYWDIFQKIKTICYYFFIQLNFSILKNPMTR